MAYTPDDQPATVTRTGATRSDSGHVSYTYDPMGNETSQSVQTDGAGHPAGWWTLSQTSGTTVQDSVGDG